MDINPQSAKPISDDQELAKVLAGVNQQNDEALQFDTPPTLTPAAPQEPVVTAAAADQVVPVQPLDTPASLPTPNDSPIVGYNPPATSPASNSDLESIKKDALTELRPLVDKLDLAPEEKFDTYLLLLRSTDDKALIAPAHTAAQAITDEARRAQALLDVIKEIDYLSAPQQ